ncbi:MAG: DUF4846 domain-containing protein [Flavobacteriales bacterium]|nr:DUF4846 domain-containing protein [Flavobacteriales bacterium]
MRDRFTPPPYAVAAPCPPGSFANFLAELPLREKQAPVKLFDGSLKHRQDVHAAVLEVSVGPRDLQQCADAIMRLRAEYLFGNGRQDEIAFHFTNGFKAEWRRWRQGERIRVQGHTCAWSAGGRVDGSHTELLRFLDVVFTYAGTQSLARELVAAHHAPIEAGDVFIQGGSPGHAVMVVDVAHDDQGRTWFMLAQSYMPAQDIHILKVPGRSDGSPWFLQHTAGELRTPEWTFAWEDRKRFP